MPFVISDLMFPYRAGFSTFTEKVAERSIGQIPHASLHDYLISQYDRNDKIECQLSSIFINRHGHPFRTKLRIYLI